jgi:cytochrome P450
MPPTIAELRLPYLSIEDPAFAVDPMPHFEAARRQHPWLARCAYGYIVHEYQAIRDLLFLDDRMRPSMDSITAIMGARGTPWGDFMDNLMLAKSPPEHTRLRNSVLASFTPRAIDRHRSLMREVVSRLLDQWQPKGAFDYADFAAQFPITVMFSLIGASPDELPGINKSLETQGMSASLDPTLLPAMQQAYGVLYDFVDRLIVERQRRGGGHPEELLNTLIAANTGGQLSDMELRNLLIFLFAAGYDTSKNMLTLLMYRMLQLPEQWQRCAVDRSFCDKVVEETFRFHSTSNVFRTLTRDVDFRDVRIPAGTVLILTLTLSGRDPTAFRDAGEFLPERTDPNRHIAFGRGIHICLGQHLARAQIQEGVHLIARRITHPRLAGPVTWRPFPGVWGIRSLPIEFESSPTQSAIQAA